ncbi:sugar-binding protein [Paraoerskovia sediminicola]|uniref:Sugar-binding protein n=1 Tax=Paraoerskovia sediminicola TaxID=1138587 RepID=A0ABM8G1J8_9CELL|nr:extracellular solute-binding protein [Paraoerskovia sediminicola]BDZ41940.1 sugar-binding protein [Paraoerskovia sediminicola]
MGVAGAAFLAACSGGSSGSSGSGGSGGGSFAFWDMPWGSPGPDYLAAGQDISKGFTGGTAEYQSISWDGWLQTFSSAIAAGTGPAISTGGAFQSLQYYVQDAIHPADGVIDKLKSSGALDDFLPGTIDAFQYQGTYTAVPWNVDSRLFFYRKSLLEAAGVDEPTTWDEFLAAGQALKKNGVYGLIASGGAGGNAYQTYLSLVINNGGGLFNAAGEPECVTDANLETMEFLLQMAKDGILDPGSVSYSTANLNDQISSGAAAMSILPPDIKNSFDDPALQDDIVLGSPLTSPNGTKGTMAYTSDLMMYTGDWDNGLVEDFCVYYLDAMADYWKQGVLNKIPVRQSILDLPEVQEVPDLVKATEEWLPVGKSLTQLASEPFPEINAVDGGQAITQWAQEIAQGQKSGQEILETLQAGIEKVM